ncbi:MAG TPA: hypothetical protein PK720_01005 [bacterium]|jgi:heat-inducible transcriptional repressor|nr:hypothetical protein [bacterium]
MDERKRLILNIIIQEHIETGQPVASNTLVEKYKLEFSPATVRNEMAELEAAGWITQPYTSAGRIPTEQAYNLYIRSLEAKSLTKREEILLEGNLIDEVVAKQTAKKLAQLSNLAVVWAFHKNYVYYTGVSNLLHQPEFNHPNLVYDISSVIDRIDEIVSDVFEITEFSPRILLGNQSPFGIFSGTIISRYQTKDSIGLIALIGPLRMDYEKNLARIEHIIKKLTVT